MNVKLLKTVAVCALAFLILHFGANSAWAEEEIKLDTGNNAWMLVSCALVLLMTAPGLAMFYGGLVRRKNVLSVMMQCFFLMGLMTVLWAVVGFTLAFGSWPTSKNDKGEDVAHPLQPWIGGFDNAFMKGVEPYATEVEAVENGKTVKKWETKYPMEDGGIPRLTFMLFQGMFFIITPALICGAFAERMKFSTMVVFSIVWGLVVYCPLAHWVWGGGILAYGAKVAWCGALDFAGGTVVHISSGVSALVIALVIGKRLGHGSEPMPPHNMTYTLLGAAMLWVGWFGFNAGSALAANGLAAGAFAATHFAAAAGAVAWALAEWIQRGKPSALGAASGCVAGLVCITPAAGFVQPMPAIVMGLLAGLVCYYACTLVKSKCNYDDSLDAFGVHGVGGTLGAILTGVFATRVVFTNDGEFTPLGLVDGGTVIWNQIGAVVITWVLAAVGTFIIIKVLDATMGLRVTQEQEIQGLDVTQHGEEGYINL